MDMNILSGPWGNCPVQAWGTLGEYSWYFRARWDGWSFDVSTGKLQMGDIGMPTNLEEFWAGEFWTNEGSWGPDDVSAGWMPDDIALGLIKSSVALFEASQPAR